MDWDKLRIFHAAAQAGSFTHAGENLNMSQSAVSRQVSGLEQDLGVALFHRHARGLILTEQGEHLFRTVNDVMQKLEGVRSRLAEASEKPTGPLRLTTTVGLGSTWLTDRIHEFIDLYPDVRLQLILDDEELDLGMREADVAIRLRQPTQIRSPGDLGPAHRGRVRIELLNIEQPVLPALQVPHQMHQRHFRGVAYAVKHGLAGE